tara:strand:+ start:44 stop:922 length:879 start_codon:yes stop_codon:yes gene_type:complete
MKSILKLQIMICQKYLSFSKVLILLVGSFSWAQFIEINAELDLRRLSEGERQLFTTLADDIENYLLNTQFSAITNDLGMAIDIRLVLESVSQGGSQTTINAQAIFSNKLDQYFYAKGIQFPYYQGRKMYYTTAFDPLASFLDYYAFMFIATELDTWDYLGGTSFFNRAIELSDLGKDSDWSSGWDDRWKKSRKIKSNQYLRSMRFNYFMALDALAAEEVDLTIVINAMNTFHENLLTLDKKLGSNKETLHFLKAYHESIAELLSLLNLKDALELLIMYDHDHKKVYESYLKN